MGTSPLPSRGPTSGRKCYVTTAFSGVPSKGDKIKNGCIEGKDKTLDVQSKRIPLKFFFTQMVCQRRKTPLNPPPPPDHFQKRGGFQNPPRYRISQNPPRPWALLQWHCVTPGKQGPRKVAGRRSAHRSPTTVLEGAIVGSAPKFAIRKILSGTKADPPALVGI